MPARRFEDSDADGGDFGVHAGERNREAQSDRRRGQRDVEKIDSQGAALARIGADLPFKRLPQFGAIAVVLHTGWLGFGIGEYAAVARDDGEPCARSGPRLRASSSVQ